eukprot:TRINITY_DN7581_c0_g1_i1.p1 TRINITY_DN7581_c0_g1~~TRINITY_DN7581_c0_g1_i1.p1  ORF type:complete len:625 (+),score=60.17 TRINITY_DN7581_c0_g1_i1:97-1875(+)
MATWDTMLPLVRLLVLSAVLAEPQEGDNVPLVFRSVPSNQSFLQELIVQQKAWSDVQRRDLRVMQQQLPGINVTLGDAPMGMSGFLIHCDSYRKCPCSNMSNSPTCGRCKGVPCVDLYYRNTTPLVNRTSCCCERPSGYWCNTFHNGAGGGCGSVCCKSETPDGQRATLCGNGVNAVCCAPRLGHVYNCGTPVKKTKGAISAQPGCCVRKDAPQWEMMQQGCCNYGLGYNCQDAQRGVTSICCLSHLKRWPGDKGWVWPFRDNKVCQPPVKTDPHNATLACADYVTYTLTQTLPADQDGGETVFDWLPLIGTAVVIGVGLLAVVVFNQCRDTQEPQQPAPAQPPANNRKHTCDRYFFWFDPDSNTFVEIQAQVAPSKLPACVSQDSYEKTLKMTTKFSTDGVEHSHGGLAVLGNRRELLEYNASAVQGGVLADPPCRGSDKQPSDAAMDRPTRPPLEVEPTATLDTDGPRRAMVPDGAIAIDGISGEMFKTEWHISIPNADAAQRARVGKLVKRGTRTTAAISVVMGMAKQGKPGCVAFAVSQDNTVLVLISSGTASGQAVMGTPNTSAETSGLSSSISKETYGSGSGLADQ